MPSPAVSPNAFSDILLTEFMLDNFHKSNQTLYDSSQTEYLLIIGNNGDNKLSWTYHKFNSDGRYEKTKRQLTITVS